MTKILALDSSTDACSVALHINGVTDFIFELAAKSHTQRLLPMVDEILHKHNCRLQDIDAIAYGRGPGSFTGLRICMGVVQGLAFGANLPVIPVSTLQAMAHSFAETNPQNNLPIIAALDARMDEIYWSIFSADAKPQFLSTEQVMSPVLVCQQEDVTQYENQFIAIGAGWHYPALSVLQPRLCMLDVYPHAKSIADLAVESFNNTEQISILDAQPVYLRDSVSWQKRQRIRTTSIEKLL
jgi:tRNA threonylcarbamoyladenosine biosynthesis protein TsaB